MQKSDSKIHTDTGLGSNLIVFDDIYYFMVTILICKDSHCFKMVYKNL